MLHTQVLQHFQALFYEAIVTFKLSRIFVLEDTGSSSTQMSTDDKIVIKADIK